MGKSRLADLRSSDSSIDDMGYRRQGKERKEAFIVLLKVGVERSILSKHSFDFFVRLQRRNLPLSKRGGTCRL